MKAPVARLRGWCFSITPSLRHHELKCMFAGRFASGASSAHHVHPEPTHAPQVRDDIRARHGAPLANSWAARSLSRIIILMPFAARLQVPIDLANVCFDGGASPDRLAALDAMAELQTYAPDRCLLPWVCCTYCAEGLCDGRVPVIMMSNVLQDAHNKAHPRPLLGFAVDAATVVLHDQCWAPPKVSAAQASAPRLRYCQRRDWRLIEVDSSLAEADAHRRRLLRLLTPADTVWLRSGSGLGSGLGLGFEVEGSDHLPASSIRVIPLLNSREESCSHEGKTGL